MAVFDKITEGIGAGYQFDLQTHPNPRHFKFGHTITLGAGTPYTPKNEQTRTFRVIRMKKIMTTWLHSNDIQLIK